MSLAAPSSPDGRFRIIAILGVLVFVVLAFAAWSAGVRAIEQTTEDAFGCDGFGYLRQARLFQQDGWVGGLNTAMRDPVTVALVDIATATGRPHVQWDEAVAPHCHHYVPSTRQVILQYPPGTGWLMSFFPEGRQVRGMSVAVILTLLACFAVRLAGATTRLAVVATAVLGLFSFLTLYSFDMFWSIVPTALCMTVMGYLCASVFTDDRPSPLFMHAAFGLAAGLAVNFRTANVFLIAGLIPAYGIRLASPGVKRGLAEGICFGCGVILGLVPILAAQAINTGSPFTTTYSAADASMPSFGSIELVRGLRFYFVEEWQCGVLLVAAVAFLQVGNWLYFRNRLHAGLVLLAVAIELIFNVGYFLLRPIREAYYVAPVAMFAVAATAAALEAAGGEAATGRQAHRVRWLTGAIFVALWIPVAVQLSGRLSTAGLSHFANPVSSPTIEPDAVVWADLSSGTFYYYLHRQAAKLASAGPSMRDELVSAVAASGRPQYLVLDSANMKADSVALARDFDVRPVGSVFGSDILRIAPRPR